jgi:hypothetical protein
MGELEGQLPEHTRHLTFVKTRGNNGSKVTASAFEMPALAEISIVWGCHR